MQNSLHRLFNNRTRPLFEIAALLLVFAGIRITTDLWHHCFRGTLYGTCRPLNEPPLQTDKRHIYPYVGGSPFQSTPIVQGGNLQVSWDAGGHGGKSKILLTTATGDYLFYRQVPLGYNLEVTVSANTYTLSKTIGEIEGVHWLFGIPSLGLPVSVGHPKRVDFTIPPRFTPHPPKKMEEETDAFSPQAH